MRKLLMVLGVGIVFSGFIGCVQKQNPVDRGKYLMTIGGCHDCHTSKVEGAGGMP
jgi:hypothetical protein